MKPCPDRARVGSPCPLKKNRGRPGRAALVPVIFFSVLGVRIALAQETMSGESATQPSPGTVVLKEQVHYFRLNVSEGSASERGTIEETMLLSSLNVGVARDLSLSFRLPVQIRRREFDLSNRTEQEEGIGDFLVLGKWRFWNQDTGPLDTARAALVGGMDVRTGDDPFTADAYSPVLGAAYTQICGRHGLNLSAMWKFTTGGNDFPVFPGESTADFGKYDLSYLYRLTPKEYTADTRGAWYAIAEMNGSYETNGDHELFLSPGLMYEGRTWALEMSVQLPVREKVEYRPDTDFMVMAGVRFSF